MQIQLNDNSLLKITKLVCLNTTILNDNIQKNLKELCLKNINVTERNSYMEKFKELKEELKSINDDKESGVYLKHKDEIIKVLDSFNI